MEKKDFLTAEEAMQYLGVSRATLWKLLDRYKLPRYKMPLQGKRIFLRREDLDRLREPIRYDEGDESERAA